MLMIAFIIQFVAFPSRKDALLSNESDLQFFSSGSSGSHIVDKCVKTNENNTVIPNEHLEWCSNIFTTDDQNPYLIYTIKNKAMKVKGYSIRNGCCHYYCCDVYNDGHINDIGCCCYLYSFSLLGSNDNMTWKQIHSVQKDNSFWTCKTVTYEFPLTESFKFIKFHIDETYPGCSRCVQINQIELYGEKISDISLLESNDDDESISIIGKIPSLKIR